MDHLEGQHPAVYQHFLQGFHVVRISERCWAGLFSDLIIEQVLLRSLKQLVLWLEEPVWVRLDVWYGGYYQTVRQQRWTWQCKNFLLSATKPASNTKTHLLLIWQHPQNGPQETHSQLNLSCTAWSLESLQMSLSMLSGIWSWWKQVIPLSHNTALKIKMILPTLIPNSYSRNWLVQAHGTKILLKCFSINFVAIHLHFFRTGRHPVLKQSLHWLMYCGSWCRLIYHSNRWRAIHIGWRCIAT